MLKLKKINILTLFILLGCFQNKNSSEKIIKLTEKPQNKYRFVQTDTPEYVKNIFRAIEELDEKEFLGSFTIYLREKAYEVIYLNEFEESMLAFACKKGFFEAVNFMLRHPNFREAINKKDKRGYTPLILAIQLQPYKQGGYEVTSEKKFELIKLLLEKGAGVHIRDNEGVSAIVHATRFKDDLITTYSLRILAFSAEKTLKEKTMQEGKLKEEQAKKIIDLLKEHGAGLGDLFGKESEGLFEFFKEKNFFEIKFKHEMSQKSRQKTIDMSLIEAIERQDVSQVYVIIEEGANPNVQDDSGNTALHIACKYLADRPGTNIIRIIQLLYKPRMVMLDGQEKFIWGKLDIKNRLGETPVGLYFNYLVNLITEHEKRLSFSFDEFAIQNFLSMINHEKNIYGIILKKEIQKLVNSLSIDLGAKKRRDDSVVKEIVAYLPEYITELIFYYTLDPDDKFILKYPDFKFNEKIFSIKPIEGKKFVNCTSIDIIKQILRQNYISIGSTEFLIENKAEVKESDKYNISTLHEAVMKGDLEKVELFLKQGAKVNFKDKEGDTALHIAIRYIKENKETFFSIIKYLLDYGADLNIENERKETPVDLCEDFDILKYILIHAVKENDADTALKILNKGNWTNIKEEDESTLLMYAVGGNDLELVRLLVEEKGYEIDAEDSDHSTVLMYAAEGGNLEIMDYLLKKLGPDDLKSQIDRKNKFDDTALLIAVKRRNINVAELLIDHEADTEACDSMGISTITIIGEKLSEKFFEKMRDIYGKKKMEGSSSK